MRYEFAGESWVTISEDLTQDLMDAEQDAMSQIDRQVQRQLGGVTTIQQPVVFDHVKVRMEQGKWKWSPDAKATHIIVSARRFVEG